MKMIRACRRKQLDHGAAAPQSTDRHLQGRSARQNISNNTKPHSNKFSKIRHLPPSSVRSLHHGIIFTVQHGWFFNTINLIFANIAGSAARAALGPDRAKTRPSEKPFQVFGEFWPILSDRRLADPAKPLWTSPFSGKIRVFTRSALNFCTTYKLNFHPQIAWA
jgi:hypothetical protein